jgi:tryptophan synthase alpha chain
VNNRLLERIGKSRRRLSKLFCAYVTLGYPSLAATETAIRALESAGTDILELGFPFSDPLADGPTIQQASEYSLRKGVHLSDAFRLIKKLRTRGLKMPVLLFSYMNPILQYGVTRMAFQLRRSGFDGAVIPDMPPEEGKKVEASFRRNHLSLVYLVAPTTAAKRAISIGKRSSGFIYYVSLRGVTGARSRLPADLSKKLKALKRVTKKPILVGFGVSQPRQAQAIAKIADGIVVGSAIVSRLRNKKNSGAPIKAFARQLIRSMNHG